MEQERTSGNTLMLIQSFHFSTIITQQSNWKRKVFSISCADQLIAPRKIVNFNFYFTLYLEIDSRWIIECYEIMKTKGNQEKLFCVGYLWKILSVAPVKGNKELNRGRASEHLHRVCGWRGFHNWLWELRKWKLSITLPLGSKGIVKISTEIRNEKIGMKSMCSCWIGYKHLKCSEGLWPIFFLITTEEKCTNVTIDAGTVESRNG